MSQLIYLDNAATTPTKPEVVEAMLPYFTENFGNPSAVYGFASKNKAAVTEAREKTHSHIDRAIKDPNKILAGFKWKYLD